MNWIKNIIKYLKPYKDDEKDIVISEEAMLSELRKRYCGYTENPFSTDLRNYMQRVKISDSITGWGMKMLEAEEIKRRLDKGLCWLDYPVLNGDGTEILGLTGKDFA